MGPIKRFLLAAAFSRAVDSAAVFVHGKSKSVPETSDQFLAREHAEYFAAIRACSTTGGQEECQKFTDSISDRRIVAILQRCIDSRSPSSISAASDDLATLLRSRQGTLEKSPSPAESHPAPAVTSVAAPVAPSASDLESRISRLSESINRAIIEKRVAFEDVNEALILSLEIAIRSSAVSESKLENIQRRFSVKEFALFNLYQDAVTTPRSPKESVVTNLERILKMIPEAQASAMGVEREMGPRYLVRKQIGEGSYGTVYRCYDIKEKSMVAVKLIRGVFSEMKGILREIQILHGLSPHRNIIRILDIGIANRNLEIPTPGKLNKDMGSMTATDVEEFEDLYISMELCDSDLTKVIRQDDFTISTVLDYMRQILVGLQHLQSRGIFHRDLKPGNILICGDSVKIADFGLARSANIPAADGVIRPASILTREVVTRWYRAPEVSMGLRYGNPSDVFSVGLILGEMLRAMNGGWNRRPLVQSLLDSHLGEELREPDKSQDHLLLIFQLVGRPAVLPARFANYASLSPTGNLLTVIPSMSADLLAVLVGMLSVEPDQRWTVDRCLASPIFAKPGHVKPTENPLVLPVDSDETEKSVDYFRKAFVDEMIAYHFGLPRFSPSTAALERQLMGYMSEPSIEVTLEDLLAGLPNWPAASSDAGSPFARLATVFEESDQDLMGVLVKTSA